MCAETLELLQRTKGDAYTAVAETGRKDRMLDLWYTQWYAVLKAWKLHLQMIYRPIVLRMGTEVFTVNLFLCPWLVSFFFFFICRETVHKPLRLRLQSPKPALYNSRNPVKVTLVLDPKCKYSVRWGTAASLCVYLQWTANIWVRFKNWIVGKRRNQAGWCSSDIIDLCSGCAQFKSVLGCKTRRTEAIWKI